MEAELFRIRTRVKTSVKNKTGFMNSAPHGCDALFRTDWTRPFCPTLHQVVPHVFFPRPYYSHSKTTGSSFWSRMDISRIGLFGIINPYIFVFFTHFSGSCMILTLHYYPVYWKGCEQVFLQQFPLQAFFDRKNLQKLILNLCRHIFLTGRALMRTYL